MGDTTSFPNVCVTIANPNGVKRAIACLLADQYGQGPIPAVAQEQKSTSLGAYKTTDRHFPLKLSIAVRNLYLNYLNCNNMSKNSRRATFYIWVRRQSADLVVCAQMDTQILPEALYCKAHQF
jgi:hypothetical protein